MIMFIEWLLNFKVIQINWLEKRKLNENNEKGEKQNYKQELPIIIIDLLSVNEVKMFWKCRHCFHILLACICIIKSIPNKKLPTKK